MKSLVLIAAFAALLVSGGRVMKRIDLFLDHHVVKYDGMNKEEKPHERSEATEDP